jgi:hypothetical protein
MACQPNSLRKEQAIFRRDSGKLVRRAAKFGSCVAPALTRRRIRCRFPIDRHESSSEPMIPIRLDQALAALTGGRVKPTAGPQQVIDRLAERWGKARLSAAHCKLGREPRRRRGGACSDCTHPQEFEIDQAITQLINSAAFRRAGICPYQVVASHLVAGLTVGPEVSRLRSAGQPRVDPVREIKSVLKRIRNFLHATGSTRDNIEAIAVSNHGSWWQALYAVLTAERDLEKALALFQSEVSGKSGRSRSGRTGELQYQAIARATAGAWRELTGRLPAKDNSKFHGLLAAVSVTIFGHFVKEPNWESATKIAVKRIREDTASRS